MRGVSLYTLPGKKKQSFKVASQRGEGAQGEHPSINLQDSSTTCEGESGLQDLHEAGDEDEDLRRP